MRLSIVNYPKTLSPKMRTTVTAEDDAILASAREIVNDMNLGRGALIVSEVLHTDLSNLNNRTYKKKGMAEAAQSFVAPYPTPFIMHHDMGGGGLFGGGDPKLLSIGSNIVANYYGRRTETANGIASGYVKVGTFIPEAAMIGNTKAIDAIQSRLLFALSIGASVTENNYLCSICGKPINGGECEHVPGRIYEGAKCIAEVFNPVFKEYSAVYSPSDVFASIKRMDLSESSKDPLLANECQLVDSGLDICEIALYGVGSKIYPSADTSSNISNKEEDQATMATNAQEKTPETPTPEPTVTIDETQKPAPVPSTAESLMAKALDIVATRCEKSDEVVTAALKVIEDMATVIGDLRTVKEEVPATETTTETKTESSASEPAPKQEPEAKPEESSASTTNAETPSEETTPEQPATGTDSTQPAATETGSSTEVPTTEQTPAAKEQTPTQETTKESTPKNVSMAELLAKRRTSVAQKNKYGFQKKHGRK